MNGCDVIAMLRSSTTRGRNARNGGTNEEWEAGDEKTSNGRKYSRHIHLGKRDHCIADEEHPASAIAILRAGVWLQRLYFVSLPFLCLCWRQSDRELSSSKEALFIEALLIRNCHLRPLATFFLFRSIYVASCPIVARC